MCVAAICVTAILCQSATCVCECVCVNVCVFALGVSECTLFVCKYTHHQLSCNIFSYVLVSTVEYRVLLFSNKQLLGSSYRSSYSMEPPECCHNLPQLAQLAQLAQLTHLAQLAQLAQLANFANHLCTK